MIYNIRLRIEVNHDGGDYSNEIGDVLKETYELDEKGNVSIKNVAKVKDVDNYTSVYDVDFEIDTLRNQNVIMDDLDDDFIVSGKFDITVIDAQIKEKTKETINITNK